MKQAEGARARLEDNLYEMSKPLTRTKDDVDREMLLKEQVCLRPFFSENDKFVKSVQPVQKGPGRVLF